MRKPMLSGHCHFPSTDNPDGSHELCHVQGGGNRANPNREFQPCPCACHLGVDSYECGNCGGELAQALTWPNEWPDEADDDPVFTHVDPRTGMATGEECPS